MHQFPLDRPGEPSQEPESFQHYPADKLPTLLPVGQTFALNLELGTLSLLIAHHDGPQLAAEQQFTPSELSVLKPLLESYPHFCPYEVLLASFYSLRVTDHEIERSRERLQEAQETGAWDQEMRPVRNVLSRTRLKLHTLGVDVFSILETGYILMPKKRKRRGTP